MSVTGRGLVTKAMQKAGLLTKTEQPSADEINDGLYALNAMLSTWSNQAMLINVRTIETFPLVAGTASYSIGTGQTMNTTRPMFVNDSTIISGGIDYDVTCITDVDYNDITNKTQTGIPYWVNYNNGYPYGTLKFFPTPDQAYSFRLLSEKPITDLTLDATVVLPPGWEEAIIYNLAVRLASEYGQPTDQFVMLMAASTVQAIKAAIMRNQTMDCLPKNGIPLFRSGYYV